MYGSVGLYSFLLCSSEAPDHRSMFTNVVLMGRSVYVAFLRLEAHLGVYVSSAPQSQTLCSYNVICCEKVAVCVVLGDALLQAVEQGGTAAERRGAPHTLARTKASLDV